MVAGTVGRLGVQVGLASERVWQGLCCPDRDQVMELLLRQTGGRVELLL